MQILKAVVLNYRSSIVLLINCDTLLLLVMLDPAAHEHAEGIVWFDIELFGEILPNS